VAWSVPGGVTQAIWSRTRLLESGLFCRTHEPEGLDNLFAVGMFINLACGPVAEFVLVICRNRIAEHQRVNDPDCSWLHCQTPHQMHRPSEKAPCMPHANSYRGGGSRTMRKGTRPQAKSNLRTVWCVNPLACGAEYRDDCRVYSIHFFAARAGRRRKPSGRKRPRCSLKSCPVARANSLNCRVVTGGPRCTTAGRNSR
jgi:hypothetical protein